MYYTEFCHQGQDVPAGDVARRDAPDRRAAARHSRSRAEPVRQRAGGRSEGGAARPDPPVLGEDHARPRSGPAARRQAPEADRHVARGARHGQRAQPGLRDTEAEVPREGPGAATEDQSVHRDQGDAGPAGRQGDVLVAAGARDR